MPNDNIDWSWDNNKLILPDFRPEGPAGPISDPDGADLGTPIKVDWGTGPHVATGNPGRHDPTPDMIGA